MTMEEVVRQQSQIINQQRGALGELTKIVKNQSELITDCRGRIAQLEDWASKQGSEVPPQVVEGRVVHAAAGGAPQGPASEPAAQMERALGKSNRLPDPDSDSF